MNDNLLQDQDRGLTEWLASKPGARLHAREAAKAIVPEPTYSQWRDFYAQRITTWLTAEELRAEVSKLPTGNAPSAELLLVHAMRLIDNAGKILADERR